MSEERSGAEILVESLVRQGVEVVFGYPGGAVLPIYDAIFKDDRIRHILVRQEAGGRDQFNPVTRTIQRGEAIAGPHERKAISGQLR